MPKEMSIVSKYAETDLSAEDALTFLASFYRLNPTKVGHTVAKGGFGTSPDGQSIVSPRRRLQAGVRVLRGRSAVGGRGRVTGSAGGGCLRRS